MKLEKSNFFREDQHKTHEFRQVGATSIEYALLASLITLVILGAVQLTGNAVFSIWSTRIAEAVGRALNSL